MHEQRAAERRREAVVSVPHHASLAWMLRDQRRGPHGCDFLAALRADGIHQRGRGPKRQEPTAADKLIGDASAAGGLAHAGGARVLARGLWAVA